MELNQIVGSLKKRDLLPALKWCENNRPALKKRYVWSSVSGYSLIWKSFVFLTKYLRSFVQFCLHDIRTLNVNYGLWYMAWQQF